MSGSVERLCTELGCGPNSNQNPAGGLLTDIRQLAQELKARDERTASLHAAIEHLATNMNAGGGNDAGEHTELIVDCQADGFLLIASQSIAGLIERQRHEHEGLLKAVAGGK